MLESVDSWQRVALAQLLVWYRHPCGVPLELEATSFKSSDLHMWTTICPGEQSLVCLRCTACTLLTKFVYPESPQSSLAFGEVGRLIP